MTTKQRAYLKSLAMKIDPVFHIGKNSITPEFIIAINESIDKKELIKIGVLKNCADDPKELANIVAERTRSEVVQVIGKKIVLYKEGKDKNKKIELPKK
ncbi:MAG: ribosome assembly RNA-binding protein YhbY [Suipraeoptans sp.]